MGNNILPDNIRLIISQILVDQSKPFQTSLKESRLLLDKDQLEEVYIKTITPIFQALETLLKANKIDSNQYNQRLTSLLEILQLVEDIIAKEAKNRKYGEIR